MTSLGKYAGTIIACYGAVGLVVAGLVAWLLLDGRRLAAQLAALEARGVRRRSHGVDEGSSAPETKAEA